MSPEPQEPGARRPRVRQRLRTPHEVRQWRRRMLTYAAMGTSLVLLVNALIGENGYLDTLQARRETAELTEQIRRVNEETQRIHDDIKRFKTSPAALEEAGRRLRLSKPGETMVVIKEQATPQPPAK